MNYVLDTLVPSDTPMVRLQPETSRKKITASIVVASRDVGLIQISPGAVEEAVGRKMYVLNQHKSNFYRLFGSTRKFSKVFRSRAGIP